MTEPASSADVLRALGVMRMKENTYAPSAPNDVQSTLEGQIKQSPTFDLQQKMWPDVATLFGIGIGIITLRAVVMRKNRSKTWILNIDDGFLAGFFTRVSWAIW